MNKKVGVKSGITPPAGSSPSLAKELGEIIEIIQEKKYVTNKVLELLREWEETLATILEGRFIEIYIDGEKVGFKHFVDWAGTTMYKKYLFHINEEILPRSREEIGKVFCNYTNVLSRRWHILDMTKLKWLIRNIGIVTTNILKFYAEEFPGEYDLQKMEKVVSILKEVK